MIQLKVNADSLRINYSKNFIGIIYFKFGEIGFPDLDWFDFNVRVLGWWADAYLPLLSQDDSSAEFLFMEGPCSVRVKRNDTDRISFTAIANNKIQVEDSGSLLDLGNQLVANGKLLLTHPLCLNSTHNDVVSLHRAIKNLETKLNLSTR